MGVSTCNGNHFLSGECQDVRVAVFVLVVAKAQLSMCVFSCRPELAVVDHFHAMMEFTGDRADAATVHCRDLCRRWAIFSGSRSETTTAAPAPCPHFGCNECRVCSLRPEIAHAWLREVRRGTLTTRAHRRDVGTQLLLHHHHHRRGYDTLCHDCEREFSRYCRTRPPRHVFVCGCARFVSVHQVFCAFVRFFFLFGYVTDDVGSLDEGERVCTPDCDRENALSGEVGDQSGYRYVHAVTSAPHEQLTGLYALKMNDKGDTT